MIIILYIVCRIYFIFALCRFYSWNISFLPLQFSDYHTATTFNIISHLLDCISNLDYVCDTRYLKPTIFGYCGCLMLAQNDHFRGPQNSLPRVAMSFSQLLMVISISLA